MKKSQAAMEFLMIYGWAILGLLVIVGALSYYGIHNTNKLLPEECTLYSGSTLTCEDFVIEGNSKVIIKLKNRLTNDITGVAITLTNKRGTGTCANLSVGTISGGESKLITLSCSPTLPSNVKADMLVFYSVGSGQKKASGSLVGNSFGGTMVLTPTPTPSPSTTPTPSPSSSTSPTPSPS